MFYTTKLLTALVVFFPPTLAVRIDYVRRELPRHVPSLDFAHLGNFGAIARLPTHPKFAHLGLTPQQAVAFTSILLSNGLLHPQAIRPSNGQLLLGNPQLHFAPQVFPGNFFRPPPPPLLPPPAFDPYFLFLSSNYGKYLPYGLGAHGFYGSTGLPRVKPPGVFKYNDKN